MPATTSCATAPIAGPRRSAARSSACFRTTVRSRRAYAFAVSDDGNVVVGASGDDAREAFVWTRTTGIFRLEDYLVALGVELDDWRLDTALAISSDGTIIAGWGYRGTPALPARAELDRRRPAALRRHRRRRRARRRRQLHDRAQRQTSATRTATCTETSAIRTSTTISSSIATTRCTSRSVLGTDDPDGDLNGNGIVGGQDVQITRSFVGRPPGPSGLAD